MAKIRLRAEERRSEILSHAIKCVGAQGFKSVSVRDIAKDAGINEALIYHHFPSKENLLENIIQMIKQERPLFSVEMPKGKKEFREALRRFEQFFINTNARDATTLKIILYAVLEGYPLPEEFDPDRKGTFLSWLSLCIERGKSEWAFRDDIDSKAAISVFMGSLIYHVIQSVLIRPNRKKAVAGVFTDMFFRVLEGQRASS